MNGMDEEAQILQMNQLIAAGYCNSEKYKELRNQRIENLRSFYLKRLNNLDKLKNGAIVLVDD